MELLVFLLAVVPILFSFVGFIVGVPSDKALRERLANFYVSIHGNWENIYRQPAGLVSRYLKATFGGSPLRFPIFIAIYSLITTGLLTMAHLNLTIPQGVDSAGPILTGQGAFDFSTLWSLYLAPNLVGDLLCWPLSLMLFSLMAKARPIAAVSLALAIIAIASASFILVARLQVIGWDFLSVPEHPPDLSLPFTCGEYGCSDEWIRLSSALHELGLPVEGRTFDYWGVVPLAVFLPAILLGLTTLTAVLIVLLRPLLHRPLTLILERLDASSPSLYNTLAAFLVGLGTIITATHVYFFSQLR